ncbi:hypothetical protein OSB04_024442 [Centaurea solstitialis]|uniref:Polyprotein n=1 Tax=Centaurea solstitialis TaxID=347529 RepID=A0AA38SYF9_9ASTR|nr:hypothetical protein OSB04_024442 [Centaurea solstitialis]
MHLDNILRAQGQLYVLDKPVSRPKSNSPEKEFTQYFKYLEDKSDVMSILIFSISPELAGDLRVKSCHEVVKDMENQLGFYKHTGKLLIMKEMPSLKLRKVQSVKDHLIEMRRLFKCLTRLGYKMTQEELVYLMWYSLSKEICDTTSAYMKEPKNDVAKDICKHWMNIDQIEIGLPDAPGSGTHICNHLQRFTRRETLRKDRSNLRVGEGTPLIVEAVGSYSLSLPSGLVLDLENCYYVPKMIKNHCRLGHINKKRIELLLKGGFLGTFDFKPFDNCESCLSGKMTNQPFNKDNERATDLLEIVHIDVCGPDHLVMRQEEDTERRNRTLLDMVRSMMCRSTLPISFWGHALETAAHILNRAPTKSVEKTPYELWKEKFLSSGNTRVDVDQQIVVEDNTTPTVEPEIQHENVEPPSEPIEEVQTQDLRRSTRVRQEPGRYLGFLFSKDGGDLNEPTSYGEAGSGSESEQQVVERKWVFKKKTDMDGNVHTFKARLVAKGFTQTHETFSPVAMLKSIRILMGISAYFNYEIWQMDVKTAFLNGKLTEDVYMEEPEGFEDPKNPNKMKDLGEAAYILGIKIYRNRSKRLIGLSQSSYIDKILKKFRTDESNKGFTPMQHGIVYQQNPREPHWVAVKNILKYLRKTKDMVLVFRGSENEISVTGYSDASVISWKSSKQDMIADSTIEAKYIAASDAAKEAVWLRNFLSDLRVVANISRRIDIFYDNSGAVAQAKEPRENHKSRHVLKKYHLIRDIIGRGDVRTCKIPTDDNVTDPLTKPLARVKHEAHACSIGMQYLDASLGWIRFGNPFVFVIRCVIIARDSQHTPVPIVDTQPETAEEDCGDLNEPTSYGEAVSGSESEQWQEAMKAEMQSMYDNQVWELTDLPQHCRAVGHKWVFKKKTDMDGNVHTFKARQVAKDFMQTHGIDYDETFSPVAMLKSSRILMAISTYFNYEILQMDVKTAFLNGKLTEDVCMQQPKGFVDPKNPNEVCKLLKSIYGLNMAQCPESSQDTDKMKSISYALAIRPIMYAMLCTRPDVAYSNEISVTSYTDASFQTDIDDFRSQSGYVFTLNGGAISWKSSKQDTIEDSTTEAEYIAASDAVKEAVWLRNFIMDLRVVASISRPVDIYCDNSGAVAQANKPREHHKSRHVLRKFHLIRGIIGRGDVRI